MMRTGRTTENDGLNVMAASGRGGQQKADASPQMQRRTVGMKARSPSPARRQQPQPQQQINGINSPTAQISTHTAQQTRTPGGPTAAKHCHECGEAFPVDWAKFCCECGEKRLSL